MLLPILTVTTKQQQIPIITINIITNHSKSHHQFLPTNHKYHHSKQAKSVSKTISKIILVIITTISKIDHFHNNLTITLTKNSINLLSIIIILRTDHKNNFLNKSKKNNYFKYNDFPQLNIIVPFYIIQINKKYIVNVFIKYIPYHCFY